MRSSGFREVIGLDLYYSLHCSSFLGLPCRILNIDLAKPKKEPTMETIGSIVGAFKPVAGGRLWSDPEAEAANIDSKP